MLQIRRDLCAFVFPGANVDGVASDSNHRCPVASGTFPAL